MAEVPDHREVGWRDDVRQTIVNAVGWVALLIGYGWLLWVFLTCSGLLGC